MKKIAAVLLVLFVGASILSAQDTKGELYGRFRLDYDLTEAMTDTDPVTLGGFNIDRARLGIGWSVSDQLRVRTELDVRTSSFELRIAEAQWKLADAVVFSAGRSAEAFAPNSNWHASRFDGLGVSYNAGIATAIMQVGNQRNSGPAALTLMPAVVIKPDMGGVKLETGVNGRFRLAHGDDDLTGSANLYAKAGVDNLNVLLNYDINLFTDSDAMAMDINTDTSYSLGTFVPGFALYMRDLAGNRKDSEGNEMDMIMDLDIYTVIRATSGLNIRPFISLFNLTDANGGEMNWRFTLRFEFNPTYRF